MDNLSVLDEYYDKKYEDMQVRLDKLYDEIEEIETFIEAVKTRLYNIKQEKISGDYEKVKQDVWEENWKAMRLYSVVALVAFGVITLVSVFSLSIGKYKWVYLVYTFLSLVYFCISRCQLRSFLGKKLVIYSFFAALLLFGIITGTLITPEELTVNYIVFMILFVMA